VKVPTISCPKVMPGAGWAASREGHKGSFAAFHGFRRRLADQCGSGVAACGAFGLAEACAQRSGPARAASGQVAQVQTNSVLVLHPSSVPIGAIRGSQVPKRVGPRMGTDITDQTCCCSLPRPVARLFLTGRLPGSTVTRHGSPAAERMSRCPEPGIRSVAL